MTNVFKKTEAKLTYSYLGLLILFLILFITITYAICYFTLTKNSEQELTRALHIDQRMITERIDKEGLTLEAVVDQKPNFTNSAQLFYYVTNPAGTILSKKEFKPDDESGYTHLIANKFPVDTRVYAMHTTLTLPKGNFKKLKTSSADITTETPANEQKTLADTKKQDAEVLLGASPIISKGEVKGYIYIGNNITALHQLLNNILIILISVALCFLIVAYLLSRWMSRRAMIPIESAYSRQKRFVADASHELRTPLAVLLSATELLELEDAVEDDASVKQTVATMKSEIQRLTSLVQSLLTVARNDDENTSLNYSSFNPVPEIQNTVSKLSMLADKKHITLLTKVNQLTDVTMDQQKLQQLFFILIDNAVKYSPAHTTVTINSWMDRETFHFSVTDEGIGIAEEEQSKVFDRFFRSDKSRSRMQRGHGLGLSIAKNIVDQHKGTITVNSELKAGSTFHVKLPAKK